ncbi:MAG: glycosyltransferase family 2 protein [Methanobrevibacter sp.]|jgi:glycosyltransferase involved in cell wall biosynthesis|nr:glycosyltransferase family 2 protein [Candidatus Methanovirga aequatorialis]
MNVIIIIPVFNEEENIKDVARASLKYGDVLVVDDGSSDDTKKRAVESGAKVISHVNNEGKGAAIKTGINEALKYPYDAYIFLDGDGQHDPNLIPSLIEKLNYVNVVIGSRFLKKELKNMPFQRRLSNLITTGLISFISGISITDSQSGFRGVTREIAEIFLSSPYDDYRFESDVLIRVSSNKIIKYDEVSIPVIYNNESSYVTHKHALEYVLFISKNIIKNIFKRIS